MIFFSVGTVIVGIFIAFLVYAVKFNKDDKCYDEKKHNREDDYMTDLYKKIKEKDAKLVNKKD